jgi:hypothetical protein
LIPESIVKASLAVAILSVLAWVIGRAKPDALNADKGTIRPERISATVTIIFGVAIFGVSLALMVYEKAWVGLIGIFTGAAMAGFMAPSLTAVHAVNWDEEGVEGPSKTFGLTLGVARTRIAWSDITATGTTQTSYWYIEAKDGGRSRIHWSYLYKGHQTLRATLGHHCPDVTLNF